jgi:hypothetical protein
MIPALRSPDSSDTRPLRGREGDPGRVFGDSRRKLAHWKNRNKASTLSFVRRRLLVVKHKIPTEIDSAGPRFKRSLYQHA